MGYIQDSKQICMERDAKRCRHCGASENLFVTQLVKRKSRLAWHLSNLITLCGGCADAADKNLANKDNNRVGVMLCGGRGTRLYPLTKFQNKHTLPIGLVPMIFYPLKTLRAFGVYRVLIVVDREGADETINMLGSGKEFGLDISYKVQEGAGGISEALLLAKDFARPSDEIVCILGDNIFDLDYLDTNIDLQSNKACVFIKKVANPEAYGVAVIDSKDGNKYVKEIIEKPKQFISDMAVVGLYIYKYDVFDVITKIKPSDRGELEISSVNDYYAKEGTLTSKIFTGYWGDAGGSIQRYAECSMLGAKKANVSVEEIEDFKSVVFDDK
jgi:glucose-1-phosphate thymidylyltransferase